MYNHKGRVKLWGVRRCLRGVLEMSWPGVYGIAPPRIRENVGVLTVVSFGAG
jgi:hypothetical protein